MHFNGHSRGQRNALLAAKIGSNSSTNTNNDITKRQLHRSISWPARQVEETLDPDEYSNLGGNKDIITNSNSNISSNSNNMNISTYILVMVVILIYLIN